MHTGSWASGQGWFSAAGCPGGAQWRGWQRPLGRAEGGRPLSDQTPLLPGLPLRISEQETAGKEAARPTGPAPSGPSQSGCQPPLHPGPPPQPPAPAPLKQPLPTRPQPHSPPCGVPSRRGPSPPSARTCLVSPPLHPRAWAVHAHPGLASAGGHPAPTPQGSRKRPRPEPLRGGLAGGAGLRPGLGGARRRRPARARPAPRSRPLGCVIWKPCKA